MPLIEQRCDQCGRRGVDIENAIVTGRVSIRYTCRRCGVVLRLEVTSSGTHVRTETVPPRGAPTLIPPVAPRARREVTTSAES